MSFPQATHGDVNEDVDLTVIGSVEIFSDSDGTVYCVKCLPPDSESGSDTTQNDDIVIGSHERCDQHDLLSAVDESEGIEYSILETLSMACVNTCACTPYYTKSILKTSSARIPHDADSPMQHRQVSFSRHEILEFDLTLGHHPSAAHGPPIMLDYDSQETSRFVDVDVYEKERGPPRTRRQLRINPHERKHILTQKKGFSEAEVNQAWAEAIQIRRQRQETLNRGLLMMLFDDASESMSRKYHRMLNSLGLQ